IDLSKPIINQNRCCKNGGDHRFLCVKFLGNPVAGGLAYPRTLRQSHQNKFWSVYGAVSGAILQRQFS
ncbi:hypothetical protein, partial [Hafnia psychrotolerans]